MDPKPEKNSTGISKRRRQPNEDKSANDAIPVKTLLKSSEQESRSSESLSLESRYIREGERQRELPQRSTGDDEEDDEVVKQSSGESRFLVNQDSSSSKKICSESWRRVQEVREKATRRQFADYVDDDDEMVKQSTSEEDDDYESSNDGVSGGTGEESFTDHGASGTAQSRLTEDDLRGARNLYRFSRDPRARTQTLTQSQTRTQAETQTRKQMQTQVIPNLDNSYKCIICDRVFSSGKALGGHKGRVHGQKKPGKRTVPSRKVRECSERHQKFSMGQALGGHEASHHPKKRNHKKLILDPSNESHVVTNNVSDREQSSRPLIDLNKTEFDDDNGEEV